MLRFVAEFLMFYHLNLFQNLSFVIKKPSNLQSTTETEENKNSTITGSHLICMTVFFHVQVLKVVLCLNLLRFIGLNIKRVSSFDVCVPVFHDVGT